MNKKPTKKSLLQTVYDNEIDLPSKVKDFIDSGADINRITKYCESALRVASNNGRFDVIKLLLDADADRSQLEWTPTFYEVAYGDINSIKNSIEQHHDLETRDFWHRTPWLLSLQTGIIEKVSSLLELGANRNAVGRCGKVPMAYAIQHNDVKMLQWLIEQGFDIEAMDDFLTTPLITAAEDGMTDGVKLLIDSGADIFKQNNIPQRAIQVSDNLDVIQLLVDAGDDINDICEEAHALLIGVESDSTPKVTRQGYLKGKYRHFGSSNPERVNEPFWLEMIKAGTSAWRARDTFADTRDLRDPPVWCYQRFGRTTNILDDGRIIEIGGEHEDYYDPDFCIYNDVAVFQNEGIEIYSYPEKVFPPTDFHTATLVGNFIYIIGNLGYLQSRIPGYTPVYRLNLFSFEIEQVNTTGDNPGWIYRHKASFDSINTITLTGGVLVKSKKEHTDNKRQYSLCLNSCSWKCLEANKNK